MSGLTGLPVLDPHGLKGRDLLREVDLTREEFLGLIGLASSLKAARRTGTEQQHLAGKVVVSLFSKTSTRTRAAIDVAAAHQGATATYMDPQSSQVGHKESIADSARVLARFFDAILHRGSSQASIEEMADHADVPVHNMLTDDWHPTQMFADVLTMLEHRREGLAGLAYAYLGDARNNMGNSLLITGALLGVDVRIAAPANLQPQQQVRDLAASLAATSGARITITDNVDEAVHGAQFVHTDVWVSMGESAAVWDERIALLRPYRVDAAVMRCTGVADAKFMHCLPAFHDDRTAVGAQVAERTGLMDGIEVSHEVFESPASIVFDQAENRMHTIKALLVATL